VHQVISKFREIRTSKIQTKPALAQLNTETNFSKARGHVDNRNLRVEAEEWYSDDEQ
jgi:hypothetical protein